MAVLIVLDLKNDNFTCQKPCNHRDCAANRVEWAGAICCICGKPMEPGQRYWYAYPEDEKYIKYPNQPGYTGRPHMHALCLEASF